MKLNRFFKIAAVILVLVMAVLALPPEVFAAGDASNTAENGDAASAGGTAEGSPTEEETASPGILVVSEVIPGGRLYGDVDGNGEIGISDATTLLKYIAGWNVTIDDKASDVNGDGTVSIADVTLLIKYLSGWDVELDPGTEYKDSIEITFNTNGGSTIPARTALAGAEIRLPIPKRDKFVFNGWYLDQSCNSPLTKNPIGKDITLYAGWTAALEELDSEQLGFTMAENGSASFRVTSNESITNGNVSKYLSIKSLEGAEGTLQVVSVEDNVYTLTATGLNDGQAYIAIPVSESVSFPDFEDKQALMVSVPGENHVDMTLQNDVLQFDTDAIVSQTSSGNDTFITMSGDPLNVGDIVVFNGDDNSTPDLIVEITGEKTENGCTVYNYEQPSYDSVFNEYSGYFKDTLDLSGAILDEHFRDTVVEEVSKSPVYAAFTNAAKSLTSSSRSIKWFYIDIPKFQRMDEKTIVFTLRIKAMYSDGLAIILQFPITMQYNLEAYWHGLDNFAVVVTADTTMSIMLYAESKDSSMTPTGIYADWTEESMRNFGLAFKREFKLNDQMTLKQNTFSNEGYSRQLFTIPVQTMIGLVNISVVADFSYMTVGKLGAETILKFNVVAGIVKESGHSPKIVHDIRFDKDASGKWNLFGYAQAEASLLIGCEIEFVLADLLPMGVSFSYGPYVEGAVLGHLTQDFEDEPNSQMVGSGGAYIEYGLKARVKFRVGPMFGCDLRSYFLDFKPFPLTYGNRDVILQFTNTEPVTETLWCGNSELQLSEVLDSTVYVQDLKTLGTKTVKDDPTKPCSYRIVNETAVEREDGSTVLTVGNRVFTLTKDGKLTITNGTPTGPIELDIEMSCKGDNFSPVTAVVKLTIDIAAHDMEDWVHIPACECQGGNPDLEYRHCTACNYIEVNDGSDPDSITHFSNFTPDIHDATCTEKGYFVFTCNLCGREINRGDLDPLGHDIHWMSDSEKHWGKCQRCEYAVAPAPHEWVEGTPAEDNPEFRVDTCSVCQCTRDVCLAHATDTYTKDQIVTPATCTEMGFKYVITYCSTCNVEISRTSEFINALGHDFGQYAFDELSHCKHCQREGCDVIQGLGVHKWNDETDVVNPTCVKQGSITRTCGICNYQSVEILPVDPGAHVLGEWNTVTQTTCTTEGKQQRTCTLCHGVFSQAIPVDPDAHQKKTVEDVIVAATCTETGISRNITCCALCNQIFNVSDEYVTKKLGHEWETTITWKTATCTEEGSEHRRCTREGCGIEEDHVIPMLGHNLSKDSIGKSPSCTDSGWYPYEYCTRCSYTTKVTIPATGHSPYESKPAKTPTCTEDGNTAEIKCLICQCTLENSITLRKIDHKYEPNGYNDPTCTTGGEFVSVCSQCGDVKTDPDPANGPLGHKPGDEVTTKTIKKSTCTQQGDYNEIRICSVCHEELVTPCKSEPLGHDWSDEWDHDEKGHFHKCSREGCKATTPTESHVYAVTDVSVESRSDGFNWLVITSECSICARTDKSETKTDHAHILPVYEQGKNPTCTESGYTGFIKCGVEGCDYIYPDYPKEDLDALGHDFVENVCTRCGEFEKQYSMGLQFMPLNGIEGAKPGDPCVLVGIGTCTDEDILIPPITRDGWIVIGVDPDLFPYGYGGVDETTISRIRSITVPGGGILVNHPDCAQAAQNYAGSWMEGNGSDSIADIWDGKGFVVTPGAFAGLSGLEAVYLPPDCYVGECICSGSGQTVSLYGNGTLTDVVIYCEASSMPAWYSENFNGNYLNDEAATGSDCSGVMTTVVWGYDPEKTAHTATFIGWEEKEYKPVYGDDYSEDLYRTILDDWGSAAAMEYLSNHVVGTETTVTHKSIAVSFTEGSTIGIAKPCDQSGRIFGDWEPYTLGDHDIEVHAVFPADYKVTFIADGTTVAEVAYAYGAESIEEPDVPAKDGYTGAWEAYTLDGTDIVVNAVYTSTVRYSEGLNFVSNGDGTCYVSGIGTCTDTDVKIPPVSPEGNRVTSIGERAFYKCTGLTSITIPDSVTRIGDHAFYKCTGLTSITIPDSVTSIGNNAFYGCYSLTSITIPDGVTSIDWSTFYNCTGLTSITIPDSVTSIGSYAFTGCSGLTSITIPDSVTSIGSYAFTGCSGLTSITIPDSVTSVGEWAFYECTGLTSITIPDGVTSISDCVFNGCSSLTSITIPDSVTSVGNAAFYGCTGLTSITIPDGVTSIGGSAFYNCTGLTSITIPDGVTSIGEKMFFGCTGLTSITIPDGVTSIGERAFYKCTGLTSIKIPNSVTSVGNDAFYWCTGLTSITISDSVTSIGNSAFYGCYSLTSMTIPDGVTSIGNSAFYGCSGLTSITIPDGVTSIGYEAFRDCRRLTSIAIPDSVTSIDSYAFTGCSGLTSITIPDGVTSIGDYAFSSCSGLTSITVDPNNIYYYSQGNCLIEASTDKLILGCKNSVIPDSVTSIGSFAFSGCTGLTSITIPDSVTSIGSSAFGSCKRLTIYCEATSKPSGWDPNWNPSNRPVIWGCTPS